MRRYIRFLIPYIHAVPRLFSYQLLTKLLLLAFMIPMGALSDFLIKSAGSGAISAGTVLSVLATPIGIAAAAVGLFILYVSIIFELIGKSVLCDAIMCSKELGAFASVKEGIKRFPRLLNPIGLIVLILIAAADTIVNYGTNLLSLTARFKFSNYIVDWAASSGISLLVSVIVLFGLNFLMILLFMVFFGIVLDGHRPTKALKRGFVLFFRYGRSMVIRYFVFSVGVSFFVFICQVLLVNLPDYLLSLNPSHTFLYRYAALFAYYFGRIVAVVVSMAIVPLTVLELCRLYRSAQRSEALRLQRPLLDGADPYLENAIIAALDGVGYSLAETKKETEEASAIKLYFPVNEKEVAKDPEEGKKKKRKFRNVPVPKGPKFPTKWICVRLIIVAAVVGIGGIFFAKNFEKLYYSEEYTDVYSASGAFLGGAADTTQTLSAAYEIGCDGAFVTVRRTWETELVAMNAETIKQSDGSDKRVSYYIYNDLANVKFTFDAGAEGTKELSPEKLSSILEHGTDFGNFSLFLEPKGLTDEEVLKTAKLLDESDFAIKVLVLNSAQQINEVRKSYPNILYALRMEYFAIGALDSLDCDFVIIEADLILDGSVKISSIPEKCSVIASASGSTDYNENQLLKLMGDDKIYGVAASSLNEFLNAKSQLGYLTDAQLIKSKSYILKIFFPQAE